MYDNKTYLEHYGVKGMKWGVRKDRKKGPSKNFKKVKLPSGETLTINKQPPSVFSKLIAKLSSRIAEEQVKTKTLSLYDRSDKKVGDMMLYDEGDKVLNINWVGVSHKQRGRGYGTAAISAALTYARDQRYKKVTLEVPGNSPDARHIYKKLGFVEKEQISESDIWGGLTKMEISIKHKAFE